jgi:DNA-binding PucR family transcriptional regulator
MHWLEIGSQTSMSQCYVPLCRASSSFRRKILFFFLRFRVNSVESEEEQMSDQQRQVMALSRVASQISADEDIDQLLCGLIRSACEQGAWHLGSIMSVDLAHGDALVLTRYESSMLPQQTEDRWELATSPCLIALQTREPVYIRDALETTQFPGYRREAKVRGYRTVLVLPMASIDTAGRPMVLTVASRAVRDVGEDDLAFMSAVVQLGAIAVERAHRHRAQTLANEQLQRIIESQRTLLRDVLAGESLATLTVSLEDLLNGPVLVVDFFSNYILGSRSPLPSIYDDAAWAQWLTGTGGREFVPIVRDTIEFQRKSTVVLPIGQGHSAEATIQPLTVDDELVGALLTFGEDKPTDLQNLMLENVSFALSVQLMRSVIRFRIETRTLTELFFEIVERRWRNEDDVLGRARHLGLALTAPLRMLVIDFPGEAGQSTNLAVEGHRAVTMLARQQNITTHVVMVGSGLVCLFRDEEDSDATALKRLGQQISEAVSQTFGHASIVVLGERFEGIEPLAQEWERCWRMVRVARNYGKTGFLRMPDLGPVPILMGAADSADVRMFVDGAIGKVIEYDRRTGSDYLDTLSAYVRSGCRSQNCANELGLHVTTLRYRLSRINDLFHIDVESPERRFAVELAVHLHQLTGTA